MIKIIMGELTAVLIESSTRKLHSVVHESWLIVYLAGFS